MCVHIATSPSILFIYIYKKRLDCTREHHMAPGSISGVSATTLPISRVWRLLACHGQQGLAEWIVPGDPFALARWPGHSLPWARFLMMQGTCREGQCCEWKGFCQAGYVKSRLVVSFSAMIAVGWGTLEIFRTNHKIQLLFFFCVILCPVCFHLWRDNTLGHVL